MDTWTKISALAESLDKAFSDQRQELEDAADFFEADITGLHSLYPRDYLDLYGYRLFPPGHELLQWMDNVPGWQKSWFPLSSNYHLFVFFLDRKSGQVKRVFLDSQRDADGEFTDSEEVYPDLESFLKIVLSNFRWIQKSSFSVSVEGFFKEEVATLLPSIVSKIKAEGEGVQGPLILPFFEGTLGEYNDLAVIKPLG